MFFPQPGLQTPFNLTAETNITAIKYFHYHYQSYQTLLMAFFVVTLIMILVAPTLPANQQSHPDHPHSPLFFSCLTLHRPQVLQQHTPPSWPDGSVDRAHGLRHRPVLNPLTLYE